MAEKTILLTGASGGIGSAIIHGLSGAGYNLALHSHTGFAELSAYVATQKFTTKVVVFAADLERESDIKMLAKDVLATFGHIDVLVNNAGIGLGNMSWKETHDQWNKVLAINLTAPFLLCKEIVPHMRAQNFGRIINISSVVAHIGMPGTTAYAASKAGLEGFTRSLAKEVVGKNITANVIAYGYMDAGMIDVLGETAKKEIREMIPKAVFGPPENVLNTILFLANPTTDYITGQVMHLNGGMYLGS